ncbi:MAG: YkgJ family cysteine cluster protein [Caulobacterales bacterium]
MTDESPSEADAKVRLAAGSPDREALIAGRVVVVIDDEPVELELIVQAEPVSMDEVLPIFQGLSDLFVARGVAKAEAEGRTVSCRAGCGACCRQLVPISEPEARGLARLVEAMPEPRRSQVRARFEAALSALAPTGLLERALDPAQGEAHQLGMTYFAQGVACPFLEDEACSIHPDRPLACREYLVTSPARNCQAPDSASIEKVRLAGDPSVALLKAGRADTQNGWLPLVLALRFVAEAPPPRRDRTGPEILSDVIGRL